MIDDINLNPQSQSDQLGIKPTSAAAVDTRFDIETPKEDDGKSLFSEAVQASWVVGNKADVERLTTTHVDTDYEMSDEEFTALPDSLDDEQLKTVKGAGSEDERDALLEEFAEKNERGKWLADQGWEGTAAQVGATLLDPVLWGATLGFEVGGVALVGARLSRLGRLGRTLGAAGLSEATLAGIRSQAESDYGTSDMAFDMLAALTVTGAIEGVIGSSAAKVIKARDDETAQNIVDDFADAGAAERRNDVGKWRIDDYARRINSGNQEAASLSKAHNQDPIGGGSTSSSVIAERLRSHYMGKTNAAFDVLWDAHKAAGGGSKWNEVQNVRERRALSEKVWEARVLSVDHGPDVKKVADEFGMQYDRMLGEAEDAGLIGFKREMSNPLYMKQEWDTDQWVRLQADGVTQEELTEVISRGLYGFDDVDVVEAIHLKKAELAEIKGSNPVVREGTGESLEVTAQKELDELEGIVAARTMLAAGFVNRMRGRADGTNRSLTDLMEDQPDLLTWIKEHKTAEGLASKSDEEVAEILKKALKPASKSTGDVVDRAKRRIQIDPTASITTKSGKQLRVADLMNRDGFGLHQSYVNSMSGHTAMAQNGIKRPSDWRASMETVASQEKINHFKEGRSGDASKAASNLVAELEKDKRAIFGLPREELSRDRDRILSVLMKYNFTTSMGMASFSALSEMGRILAENGIRNVLKSVTAFDGMFSDSIRTLNKGDNVVTEVNAFNASIGDEHLVRLFNSFEETGIREGSHTNGFLSKAEIIAHRGAQLMAKGSLLAPVDKALRLLSFSSSINNMYGHLVNGKGSRLAFKQMGLTDNELALIGKEMNKHSIAGTLGHVEKLGIEKWDTATANRLMDAMTTNGARQVQKALAGEGMGFTEGAYSRVIFQFRKFAIDSYSKHLRADLRDVKNEPTRVALSTLYGGMFATMGYYGRTLATAEGKDDTEKRKFLEERLDPKVVAANAVNYMPNAGVVATVYNGTIGTFVPDVALPVHRASGQATSSIMGNPTLDKAQRFMNLFHNIPGAKADNLIQRARQFIPAQNTPLGNVLLNTAESAIQ